MMNILDHTMPDKLLPTPFWLIGFLKIILFYYHLYDRKLLILALMFEPMYFARSILSQYEIEIKRKKTFNTVHYPNRAIVAE